MGQAVSMLTAEDKNARIVAGFDINAVKLFDYPVYADPIEFGGSADVIIDFSSPASLEALLAFAFDRRIPVIVCTTGHSDTQLDAIESASKKIAIFKSGTCQSV